jgi:hypothetical protein
MKYYTSTTEFNCGIDLHARQMYVCLMDRQGTLLLHTNRVGPTTEGLPWVTRQVNVPIQG